MNARVSSMRESKRVLHAYLPTLISLSYRFELDSRVMRPYERFITWFLRGWREALRAFFAVKAAGFASENN